MSDDVSAYCFDLWGDSILLGSVLNEKSNFESNLLITYAPFVLFSKILMVGREIKTKFNPHYNRA